MSDEEEVVEEAPEEPEEAGGEEEAGDGGADDGDDGGSASWLVPIGVILFPIALYLLGQSELNAICLARQITFLGETATMQDCTTPPAAGTAMFFSCEVNSASLPTWTTGGDASNPYEFGMPADNNGDTDEWRAIGSMKQAQIFGCRESISKEDPNNSSSPNVYEYTATWMNSNRWRSPTDCDLANNSTECSSAKTGSDACMAPSTVYEPFSDTKWALDGAISAGPYSLKQDLFSIGSHALVSGALVDFDTTFDDRSMFYLDDEVDCPEGGRIGCERIQFSEGNTAYASVFALSGEGGTLSKAPTGSSFGCSGSNAAPIWFFIASSAAVTQEEGAAYLASNNEGDQMSNRLLYGALAIVAVFCCCLGPLTDMGDSIQECCMMVPACGESIAGYVDGACMCLVIAFAIGFGGGSTWLVIMIFQFVTNPFLAIGSIVLILCLCGACLYFRRSVVPKKKKKGEQASPAQAPGNMEMGQMAQPMMQPQPFMLTVPPGAGPGTAIPFTTPDGRQVMGQVPMGYSEGMQFQVMA